MILHRLHDLPVAVGADGPDHGSDREDLARLWKGHGARKGDHLVRHGFSTHTPYLARHCRRNLIGSLPRGMPTVVDESVEVRVRELDSDTERKGQRLGRFRPSTWRNTLRLVSFGGLYYV